jgi:D-arabinose 1-dehydrogenase-like Zn-dependent alcohol dehydrogenase
MGSNQDFNDMLDFISNYKIEPIIDEIIPLSEITRGFRKMEEGTQFGKLVFDHSA